MNVVASKTPLFEFATSSKDGEPNVVAITFAKVLSDDKMLVMDNFLDKTNESKSKPRIAISCWATDPKTKTTRAYQFQGDTRFETSGMIFEEACEWVKSVKLQVQQIEAVIG